LSFNSFNIFDASAGSGKTFTLVKEYLKVLFSSNKKDAYKYILAITFTNKAVGEMKERIIETLKSFADKNILEFPSSMFEMICKELSMSPNVVHNKSKTLLYNIAHNYAAFDVSTIDKFTQKLIRTFARDLNLSMNFEVELDTVTVLNEAVDRLIAKAGINKNLTEILIAFAFEKADEDKSWDISLDFYNIAKLLINENDLPFIEVIKEKSLDDFKALKSSVKEKIIALETTIVEVSDNVLTLISECGLEHNDFSRSSLPKHFQNLYNKRFDIKFDANWQIGLINNESLYPNRVTQEIASVITDIQPQLILAFNKTKQEVFRLKFLKNFYKNITPLSVLSLINKELDALKEEQNILLISEFNTIISNQIKHQPSPFIYERIGEKFRHYFIDEFQDTSVMQWENLIPLLQNSLSSENGSVMLVGDAKQAIYRWRGGKAEQFIGLCNTDNPFFIKPEKTHLPTNYRSYKAVVNFNNAFFEHLSSFMFSKKEYETLYRKSHQNTSINKQGYVSLRFLDIEKDDNRDDIYTESVFKTIENCINNGFQFKDICVLVRKKKEGVAIANHLSSKGIDIVSSETLLLHTSSEVNFISNMLKFILEPQNSIAKIEILNFLADCKFNISEKHFFLNTFIKLDVSQFFKILKEYGIWFRYQDVLQLPLYEAVETIINCFNLVKTSNAYVQFYLDFVLDYSQKNHSDLSQFIDYYDTKKETLSIVSPQGKNAVQIMTIHKSKGLEFPVIIFPYAELNIYKEINPKEWLPIDPDTYYGFSYALLNYNKDFENYSETSATIYNQHQAELELDNINLLYVALTRAIEQLHIISNSQLDKKGNENLNLFSGMFINYLKRIEKWDENTSFYEFGNSQKTSLVIDHNLNAIEQQVFISTLKKDRNIKIVTNSGYLWDTTQKEAIEKGNLIHNIMSQIKTKIDVDIALNNFLASGVINSLQLDELRRIVFNIVEHSELLSYFSSENIIYNEKDIITKQGFTLRPDRLVINEKNEVVIIDYKTGNPDTKHALQLEGYSNALLDMSFTVAKKILIYVNDTLEIKEV
jgi:ATP-dependent exoDNAse (exonuclease V) beta subunit